MRCLLIILSFVSGALSLDITARGDTNVVVGQDASLSCALSNPSGVKQVTWQRVRGDERAQTLATFSELFKDQVDDQFVGKVTLTLASFNATSIVIKNVTFEDEACYICSFNVYPAGPKRETLCLTVEGISDITASIKSDPASDPASDHASPASDADVTVTCSATGKPAPTLQWKSTEKDLNLKLSEAQNSSKLNSDTSATTTSNIIIPLSQFHGKYVECVAQSGNIEDRYQIYIPGGDDKVNIITSRSYVITILVLVVMLIVVVAITVIFHHCRLKGAISRIKYDHYTEPPTSRMLAVVEEC